MARRRYSYSYYPYYPPSTPRKTEGGMKIKSKRGEIGGKWWSKRLLSILSSYGWSGRLDRGRRYARSGQVLRINIGNGRVQAEVQGSRSTPYKVEIVFPLAGERSWKEIFSYLKEKPEIISHMLTGELLPEVEEAFRKAKSPIFPEKPSEITMNCDCPDYANPCKHIAAVFYVLADNLDEDPFLLFQLKGKKKDEVMRSISEKSEAHIPAAGMKSTKDAGGISAETLSGFWRSYSVRVKPVAGGNKPSISPLKKYPLPEDFNDPLVISILTGYYNEIEKRMQKLIVNDK
ncbi:MAG: SWIM zinc finger family protein [Thermoplasmata archaeon]